MDPIRFAINRPVSVTVGVLMVVMFGLIGFKSIPVQLTPTVDRPIITVTTNWPGRSPEEVVDEIAKQQEKFLKSVANLRTMYTTSREGTCEVQLEFYVNSNIQRALQEVSDALRQVPQYPEEVDQPIIKAAEGAAENAIAWIIVDMDPAKAASHPGYDVSTLFDAMDREVRPYLERIDGVAEVNVYGGRRREVHVLVDAQALAQRQLSHAEVVSALRAENRNVSAGSVPEGKRDYRVRLVGQFRTVDDVLSSIIAYRDGRPVYVRDVATAQVGHERSRGFVRSMGIPCLAINVIRQSNANVVSIMKEVRARIDDIRTDILPRLDPPHSKDLRIRQVYDETVYIDSAINLVKENLYIGGALSVLVLLVFLRSLRSTLIIAISIPVSIIGTFLVMVATGRTLNVISLAGLAFATGVVVDNSIVVLENIDRRRSEGDPPLLAVYRGSREVWMAILSATVTTVAVFIPILTVKEEAGQLFFDLTLALAVAVGLSFIAAITIVPAAAAIFARRSDHAGPEKESFAKRLFGIPALLARLTGWLSRGVEWLITDWRGWTVRPAACLLIMGASVWGSLKLMPPIDYLPRGNQNLVFGGMLLPPGQSVDQMNFYADGIDKVMKTYLVAGMKNPDEEVKNLPPIPGFFGGPPTKPVGVRDFFVGAFGGTLFAGAMSQDPQRVMPVGNLLTGAMNSMPDAFGGAAQASIFGQGVGGGNNINLEVLGPDLDRVVQAAGAIYNMAGQEYGFGSRVSPVPSNFNKLQPEWRLRVNRTGRELGIRTEDLGIPVRALVDGAFAGEFRLEGRNADVLVLPQGGRLGYKEQMADVPVVTRGGEIVPISSVAEIEPGLAPEQIRRIEELPSVTIEIRPPEDKPLAQVMADIRANIIEPVRAQGLIDATMTVRLEGTAAKLDQVQEALFGASSTAKNNTPPVVRKAADILSLVVIALGVFGALVAFTKATRRRTGGAGYAALGALLLALVIAGVVSGVAHQPQLITARFVWAILVKYFILCALFESFLSPLVIMLTVPLATIGGFAGLRVVHEWTLSNPDISPQQLDVLTMIGFIILIGTVVNNAILIVEQALNFMDPAKFGSDEKPLPPMRAIAESVRTRMRPIFMTTLTTVGGGVPLVIAPGAGSEMYRGLGAVVVGGLLVSTIFTLLLVPLLFSFVLDMQFAFRRAFGQSTTSVGIRGSALPEAAASNGHA